MMPMITCISLPEQTERRQFMAKQFARLALDFRFLDAIKPDIETGWPACYERKLRLRIHGFDLTRGEIGCYLSHRQAWQNFLASDAPYLCVLEDDVELQAGFCEGLIALCNGADEWDVVRLYAVFKREGAALKTLSSGQKLLDYLDQPRGTQGYLLTRDAAAQLLRYTARMIHPIDDALDRTWEHGLRLFGVRPYLVLEQQQHASSIGSRKRPKLGLLDKLMRELYRTRTNCLKTWTVQTKRWRYRHHAKDGSSVY